MSADQRRRYEELAARILAGTATPAEKEEYAGWLTKAAEDGEPLLVPEEFVPGRETHEARMLAGIRKKMAPDARVVPVIRMRRRWKVALAAAASLILIAGGFWLLTRAKEVSPAVAVDSGHAIQDVAAPATNRATITLSNGQRVFLDSAANGVVARQGGTNIQKLANGQVIYAAAGQTGSLNNTTMTWNTLSNPRGSQPISLTLTDGSRVWLNAASSLRYPAAFAGGERRVELMGEGYFEIAKHAAAPFVVARGGTEVRVLGTVFNVNAYADEPGIKVTLLSGSVKVNTQLLRPGEQAFVSHGSERVELEAKADSAELAAAVAWRHGVTVFHHADIAAILRVIQRWYDVDVTMQGEMPKRSFFAEISRSATLSELLTVFRVNHIHYTLDAAKRRLTIMP